MRDERSKMNDIVFVNCDLLKGRDARNVDEGINLFADAAFKFQDKIRAAGNNAGMLFLIRQNFYDLVGGGCVDVFVPHRILLRRCEQGI